MPENAEDPEYMIKKNMLEAAGIDPDPELLKQPFSAILQEIQLVKMGLKKPKPPVTHTDSPKESTTPKTTEKSGALPTKREYGGETKRRLDEMLERIQKLTDSFRGTDLETLELAKQIRVEMSPDLEALVSQQEALAKSGWSDEKTMREQRNRIESLGKEVLKKTEQFIKKPDEVNALSKNTLSRIEALRKSSSSRLSRVEKMVTEQQSILAEIQRLFEEAS